MNKFHENVETQNTAAVAQSIPEGRTFQVGDRRYRLTRLKSSSDRYGPCEVCKKHVSDMYYQVEERYFMHTSGHPPFREGWTHGDCRSIFGHELCLRARRLGRYIGSVIDDQRTCDVHADGLPLETLHAPGFESRSDYSAHLLLAKAAEVGKPEAVVVADDPKCMFQERPTAGPNYRSVQGCGESFYRVYNADDHVVMTANASPRDPSTGAVTVAVIWMVAGAEASRPDYDAMVEAVRRRIIDGPMRLPS